MSVYGMGNAKDKVYGWTWLFLRRRSWIGDMGGKRMERSTIAVLQLMTKEVCPYS